MKLKISLISPIGNLRSMVKLLFIFPNVIECHFMARKLHTGHVNKLITSSIVITCSGTSLVIWIQDLGELYTPPPSFWRYTEKLATLRVKGISFVGSTFQILPKH